MTGAPERSLEIVQQLWLGGVRDVVLAPGSRSAPLALTLDAADIARDLRMHVRVDERSAGFLALGLSIGSRRPVAVVTTSGTAVGNLLPAVMEAHHTGRPLVLVTADRPDRLRGRGANQTTEQAGIFGVFAPCHDLTPEATLDRVREAVAAACVAQGPTQLNVQLDDDLLPTAAAGHRSWWHRPAVLPHPNSAPTEVGSAEVGSAEVESAESEEEGWPEVLANGPRTVVVAGDEAGPAARLLAEAGSWPLLAEPSSGARIGRNAIRTYRLLLGTGLRHQIERVVVVGHPTLSRPVISLLSDARLEVLAVRGLGGIVTDPGRVARVLEAVPRVESAHTPEWLDAWQRADAELGRAIDDEVSRAPGLSPLAVAAAVGRAVAADTTLVVGSSNPARDLDLMAAPWPPHEHRFVVGNRGLSGIDGTVSTAIGVALGRPRAARSLAYLGDLTFLHDANGLLLGPAERRPALTLVVLNDDGGAIFSTLEQGDDRYATSFERVFATPHGTDLAALCAAHDTAYERVTDLRRLAALLDEQPPSVRVVEVPVSRANRRAEAARLRDLAREVVPAG